MSDHTIVPADQILPARLFLIPLRGKPIFQSHGTHDPILPYALAERLKTELVSAGADVTFVPFRGAHEIPPPVLEELVDFLEPIL